MNNPICAASSMVAVPVVLTINLLPYEWREQYGKIGKLLVTAKLKWGQFLNITNSVGEGLSNKDVEVL